jgi:hypothetical protein
VVANDAGLQALFLATRFQLEEKGFGEVAGGDAGWMEGLNQGQRVPGGRERNFRGGGNFREFTPQKTVLIEVTNNLLRSGSDFRGDGGQRELGVEVVGQGFRKNLGFQKGLAGVNTWLVWSDGGSGPVGISLVSIGILIRFGSFLRFGGLQGRRFFFKDWVRLEFGLEEVLQF